MCSTYFWLFDELKNGETVLTEYNLFYYFTIFTILLITIKKVGVR